jgi:hypothetical protein
MWRLRAYMDDFACVVAGRVDKRRVNAVRNMLRRAGDEVNLPLGDDKWKAGEPSQK